MVKAVSLFSGGLDSILATKLILDQGIEVEAINFVTVFYDSAGCADKDYPFAKPPASKTSFKLNVFEVSSDFFNVLKNPRHGYGKNINPCIDCHIFMFKKAKEYMEHCGASFVITGEVLGERPMSQRKQTIDIIERESGLCGLIVRPLSAKLFKPTIPEQKGWVDRDRLLSIKGRSRKPQIELAKQLGITDYPGPAGGCLLTYSDFARKMRDLIKDKPDFNINDVKLLRCGRHFRLSKKAKLAVGRNEGENARLLDLAVKDDICFNPVELAGPVGIGRGIFDKNTLNLASRIIARYSDGQSGCEVIVSYRVFPQKKEKTATVLPAEPALLDRLRL